MKSSNVVNTSKELHSESIMSCLHTHVHSPGTQSKSETVEHETTLNSQRSTAEQLIIKWWLFLFKATSKLN